MRQRGGAYAWSLETIRAARDAQLRGDFAQPVRLAEAFRTNDALFTAYQARVATQSAIRLLWQPADTDAGRATCNRAKRSILTPQHARESILGTLANHGIAIGYVRQTTADSADGPEVSFTLSEWPLEFVRFNPSTNTLETRTKDNGTITITHGDGRWIVFRKFGVAPWTQDACVLPGALLWAAHGGAISDWASASFSHGQPKVVGTLATGISLGTGVDGEIGPEAQALLNTLAALVGGESGAGVLPAGSEAKLLYNGSTAWQVFDTLSMNREKAAMRIYLGTDASLGSQGGAPGVDIASLFNISSTRIQGDLEALERGYREGMIEPWARLHGVAIVALPTLTYAMPDADGERRSSQEASAIERLALMTKSLKDSGLDVTQDTIDALVDVLGVSVPCTLAAAETKSIPLTLAPTDLARVVKVREARASQGLPPLGDPRDDMFISELEAAAEATAVATAPAPAPDDGPPDGGGGAPAPPAAPTPNADGTVTVKRVTPVALTVASTPGAVTRTGPIDADGDGKINEAEAAEAGAIAGEAVDGDGDGKVDEEEDDDPRVVKARMKVAKALEKHKAKKAQREALERQAEDAAAKREAADAKQQAAADALESINGQIEEADPDDPELPALKEQAKVAKAEYKTATKEARAAEREADKLDEKITTHDDGIDGVDEALGEYVEARDEVASNADNDLSDFETQVFGDDEEAELTPEQAEQHAALTAARDKRAAQAAEASALVGGEGDYAPKPKEPKAPVDGPAAQADADAARARVSDAEKRLEEDPNDATAKADLAKAERDVEEADARVTESLFGDAAEVDDGSDTPERAGAVITGPKGGKYYIASSGEKVYVP